MRAKRRVVTSHGVRGPGGKRTPTVRRIKPAIVPAPVSSSPVARPTPGRPSAAPSVSPQTEPETRIDLSVDLGRGLVLTNPILAASGPFGYGVEHADVVDLDRLGGICTRGTTLRARGGNATPRMTETAAGLLNSVGLQNPGIEVVIERYAAAWIGWRVPVIVNLAAESVADYAELARRLDGLPGVAGVELNLSCPNGARGGLQFGLEAASAASVTAAVRRATDLPLLVKVSPNVTDVRAIGRAIADAGADALTAVNTVTGLAVSADGARPELGSGYGGLSGPAIKPVALRVVYELASVVPIPIVGMGGVTALSDVLDLMAVGAVAVAVGTAVLGDPGLPLRLVDELAAECRARSLPSASVLVGTALGRRTASPSVRAVEYRP